MPASRDGFRHASDDDITSILGQRDRTRGDLHVTGGVRVDGVVRGNIEPVSVESAVIVSRTGSVQGNIRVQRARVAGRVKGDLVVDGHLDLLASAVVEGNVSYGSMTIEAGADVNGQLTRLVPEAEGLA